MIQRMPGLAWRRRGEAAILSGSTAVGHRVRVATRTWWLGRSVASQPQAGTRGRSRREPLVCLDGLIDALKALQARQTLLLRLT